MTTTNRAALINKMHRVLKRTYKHAPLKGEQRVLESLLFACCLENTRHDTAQAALARLRGAFFDWNEIRVTTAKELAEVLDDLAEPIEAATRLKGVLQSVFESDYSFDLEQLKKQNIGAAVKRLQKLQGTTPFGVAYTTQVALGGHSIPLDKGALSSLHVLGVISQEEAEKGIVPGLERAISKSKGHEFGTLLHELGAEFFANPFSQSVRELMLSIAEDAKERFPKRTPKKPPVEPAPVPTKAASADGKRGEKAKPQPGKKPAAKKPEPKVAHAHKASAQPKRKPGGAAKKVAVKSLAKRKPR